LAEGVCLQEAGRSPEARDRVEEALRIAVDLDSPSLIARVNRGLLLIHLWNGELTLVRTMGLHVRAMAEETADPLLLFWSEWTLAVTDGLRGNTEGLRRRVKILDELADRMRSPSLRLWATELSLEYAYASGAWDLGIGIGESAVTLGRALHEHTILPRIQVWLSLIYLGRGDWGRAEELIAEAWEISGADGAAAGVDLLNVHTVVPAHIGMAALHTAREEWDRAIDYARAGLEVADRTGYVTWGIHRLLPLLAEACLQARRLEEAEAVAQRLRTSGETLDHDLARAWASAAEGILAWLGGDLEAGTALLRRGAELLEGIPMLFEGTRVRRQLAGRLWDKGDEEEAALELERAFRVFTELGAKQEVEAAVEFFRVMGRAPPNPS
jgi:tetratricopeptide (TPR) repeat protein